MNPDILGGYTVCLWAATLRVVGRVAPGFRPSDAPRIFLVLGAILLLPVGLTLWMRRAALRAPSEDRSAAWFGYWRFLHWVALGTLLAWWAAVDALRVDEFVVFFLNTLGLPGKFGAGAAFWFCLRFVPPALVHILCSVLSYPVSARLHGTQWTRQEIFRQAVWGQVAMLVPVMFFLGGIDALMENEPRLSVLWFAVAWMSRGVATRRLVKALDLAPHALTVGELRDRVFSLAQQAGVKLRQLYILPAGKGRMANAFARQGNDILLTDYLLEHLSKREVDAVVAHELAHLKRRHPTTLLVAFLLVTGGAAALYSLAHRAVVLAGWVPVLPLLILLVMLALYFFRRRYERAADAGAVKLTGDPEAMTTALVKLARLNLLPIHWGKWSEGWLTHPSTLRRAQAIARLGGIPPERVQQLLSAPATDGEHYPLSPVVVGGGKIFSTTFKNHLSFRAAWTVIAGMTLTPALAAYVAQRAGWGGEARWLVYIGGVAATLALFFILINYAPLWGYPSLQRRLRRKVEREGIRPGTGGGRFVGFAPDASPRIYEHNWSWDIGFLFLGDDCLCYWGEETRFVLQRKQVTAIRLGPGAVGWWAPQSVYVSWHDTARGAEGTFNLRPHDARCLRQQGRETRLLGQRLQAWRERSSAHDALPPPLAELESPNVGQVSSNSPHVVAAPRRIIGNLFSLAAVATCVSLLCGLPFGGVWALAFVITLLQGRRFPFWAQLDGAGWYVVLVALLVGVVQMVPYWRYRGPGEASSR